jgi:hypothetical protein
VTFLAWALVHQEKESFSFLLEHGANPNIQFTDDGKVRDGDPGSLTKEIFGKGSSVSEIEKLSQTPGRYLTYRGAGKMLFQPIQIPPYSFELSNRKLSLLMLARIRSDVFGHGLGKELPMGRRPVVIQGEIDTEREGSILFGQPTEDHLGFAHLILGEAGYDCGQARHHPQRLGFKRRFLGGGLFLGLEVSSDADALEAAIDTPRKHTVPIFEPANGERIFRIHA